MTEQAEFVTITLRLRPEALAAIEATRGQASVEAFILQATQCMVAARATAPLYKPENWG